MTWTLTSATDAGSVAESADGTRLLAAGGGVYTSTDSGATWTPASGPLSYSGWRIASSADGTTLAAGNQLSPGWLFISTNSGVTWAQASPTAAWGGIAFSADGTKLVAMPYNYGMFGVSTNSGGTWTWLNSPIPFGSFLAAVASSADGSRLTIGAGDQSADYAGGIYTSTDFGVTWAQTSAPIAKWSGIASSADGIRLAATTRNGGIYLSADGGSTWTQTAAPGTGWNAIACSADGTRLFAANGSGIWTAEATVVYPPGTPIPLGITTVSGLPVVVWPVSTNNCVLQMTTNLASDNWVTVTSGVPFIGLQMTNALTNAFFRLQ